MTSHTFRVPEGAFKPPKGFMVVNGPSIDFGEDGSFLIITDAGWIEWMIYEATARSNQPVPRFI